ncbi:MAG TPA: TPM domain-containing protein [Pyrinomonadaceae bacterium]|nr:TPM domain-containing protein [Pyrinomonadaceae bacterium]
MKLPFINQRAIIFALMLALICLSWFGSRAVVQAQARLPRPNGHVNDLAEVLDAATRDRLEKILDNLQKRTELNFVIATVKTASSEDLYDYSLRVANDWDLGAPAGADKSVLLVVAADNGRFFTQATRSARTYLPEGLIGTMGQRMRARLEKGAYGEGLLIGVRAFADGVGEARNFTFAELDHPPAENLIAKQQRPRTIASPEAQPSETPVARPTEAPVARPTETPAAQSTETPNALPTETPKAQPTEPPKAEPTATVALANASPQPSATPEASASPQTQPAETPAVATPIAVPATASPNASPRTTESPAAIVEKNATPVESPAAQASPAATNSTSEARADSSTTPVRSTDRKTTITTPANPDDEKEAVEVALALPPDKRIDALKAFIAAHPQSVAAPRAGELIVVAHALLGDQKLQAGDVDGGLQQFRLAISEAPADMPDRLFTEVIARIPANLFLRGQRAAAIESAHQAEALAKLNPKRLAAVAGFYLLIEDVNEATRLAELATQNGADSAVAHQALGEARHIALRLDDAETEFARALALEPKWASPRIALADLKRAAGKFEEALALYREQLQTDPKNNAAHAGVVVALLELGKTTEAEAELSAALKEQEQAPNLQLLVGAAYWFVAHDSGRGLELANMAVNLEPRYPWGQIALARALIANNRAQEAERSLRFVRQYSRFPTIDYELANMLAAIGLYDDAAAELAHTFSLKGGQIETMLAGRNAARAAGFIELLGPERRAVIFQSKPADTDANANMLKALLALNTALNQPAAGMPNEDDLAAMAKDFTAGNDAMRTFRQIYVAEKFLSKGVGLETAIDLMDQATSGVEAALSVPNATLAVQPGEYSDIRARALAQGGTPQIPEAPRAALSGLLRGRIEDLAGVALFKLDKANDAVARLRRAVNAAPEGTPLWRAALWHLGGALEATGKNDQALLYYIKSYVAGAPDPARRAVIETVYKKVNGSLEGLDDKIGPGFATASAPTPSPI